MFENITSSILLASRFYMFIKINVLYSEGKVYITVVLMFNLAIWCTQGTVLPAKNLSRQLKN